MRNSVFAVSAPADGEGNNVRASGSRFVFEDNLMQGNAANYSDELLRVDTTTLEVRRNTFCNNGHTSGSQPLILLRGDGTFETMLSLTMARMSRCWTLGRA